MASSQHPEAPTVGSVRSAASLASSTSVRSGPAHAPRPPPVAASAGWAGIRESLDVSGTDATVGEEVRGRFLTSDAMPCFSAFSRRHPAAKHQVLRVQQSRTSFQ